MPVGEKTVPSMLLGVVKTSKSIQLPSYGDSTRRMQHATARYATTCQQLVHRFQNTEPMAVKPLR